MRGSLPEDASGILAVDAGQSGVRLRHVSHDARREGHRPGVLTDRPLLPQIAEAVRSFLEEIGARPGSVAVGLSGLTRADTSAELLELLGDLGVSEVFLAHDSLTGYLGAMGPHRGAVVAAGTGVVTLAVGPTGVARVDGWGHVMGDAGSGYWLGQRALEAAMRAYDGRGPATRLLDSLRRRWPNPETAYVALQASPDRVALVASFAGEVDRCAQAGDGTARGLLDSAAQALAESAATALERVGTPPGAARIAVTGGVFRSEHLRRRFLEALRDRFPEVAEVSTGGTGLDGAEALVLVSSGHALAQHVDHVRVVAVR